MRVIDLDGFFELHPSAFRVLACEAQVKSKEFLDFI
jgi:hypothetical protein